MVKWTIGIDEAGRGPLAGPVAVGVFAVPATFDREHLVGIRDSKTLSEKKRNEWYDILTTLPGARWSVMFSSAEHIDTHGIQHAVRDALARGLVDVVAPYDATILLDGSLFAPREFTQQKTIVRGDATEPLISAAAILAKVTRDRHMVHMHTEYPAYGFATHKGYGTVAHRDAIRRLGPSLAHRTSFCRRIG
jgi:ribonuclease HII